MSGASIGNWGKFEKDMFNGMRASDLKMEDALKRSASPRTAAFSESRSPKSRRAIST